MFYEKILYVKKVYEKQNLIVAKFRRDFASALVSQETI